MTNTGAPKEHILTFVALALQPRVEMLLAKNTHRVPSSRNKFRTSRRGARCQEIKGDMVYVHILGHPVIIVNSFKCANELMEKRGALYSDRPQMVFINDMQVEYSGSQVDFTD